MAWMEKRKFEYRPTTQQEIAQSIRELRKMYKDMSDRAFASYYGKKFGIPPDTVLKFLVSDKIAGK